MFFKYLKGAGSSLLAAILIFIFTVGIHPDYFEVQVLFVALYNYFFCIFGIILYFIIVRLNLVTKYAVCCILYAILGLISSLILPPVSFILITGSIVFYLAQLTRDKKWSIALSLSGPLFILMIWLAF